MQVGNDMLEPLTGKGATIAGRAMLAASSNGLICSFAIFANG